MKQEEALLLEKARRRLADNYRGTIKGMQPMIAGSMQVAYAKGLEDAVKMIAKEGFTIIKLAQPPVPETEASVPHGT